MCVVLSKSAWDRSATGITICWSKSNKPFHGHSHQSGWSSFNWTTFWKESNEYSITTKHELNCSFHKHSITLLPRRDRQGLKFTLMAVKESLLMFTDKPDHLKAGFVLPKRLFGKSIPVWCCVLRQRSRCVLPHNFQRYLFSV